MALSKELAEAVARELSPEHFGHGWRPVIEAEVEAVNISAGTYMGSYAGLEVDLAFSWHTREENRCPLCGEIAVQYADPRMSEPGARELLTRVTGIEFRGRSQ